MSTHFDDYSAAFAHHRRTLKDSRGTLYLDFLKTLKPDYGRVRRDLALGYAVIGGVLLLAAIAPSIGASPSLVALFAAIVIGYWIAYIQLFLHEGAHFNLAPDRAVNDKVCDLLVSWMIGTSVATYRQIHFHHHRALGTSDDSEHTYFYPLNLRFLAKGFFGVRALEVIASRTTMSQRISGTASERLTIARPRKNWRALLALFLHGGIAAVAAIFGYWWISIAWLVGVGAVFPFLGALRQLLEHRGEDADASADYFQINHGAFTRIFADGVIGSTFGGAGFNRHLIHHWEPQASYTNLREVEKFLCDTVLATVIERRKTTYVKAFLQLVSF